MRHKFLGDSYDIVKRMWHCIFADWAPLYAEPRFIPDDLSAEFTKMTGITMLEGKPARPYSILNDPDTGVRLPGEQNQSEGRSHITITSIVYQLETGAQCVVTFDQSYYRQHPMNREGQRKVKMNSLAEKGMHSLYYVSHAPFLFASPDAQAFSQLQAILRDAGIPADRLDIVK